MQAEWNEQISTNIPNTPVRAVKGSLPAPVGSSFPLHYHEEFEFLVIYSGEFICTVDDKDYIGHPGEIIFINSGVLHSTRCECEGMVHGLLQFSERNFLDEKIFRAARYSTKMRGLLLTPVHVFSDPELFAVADHLFTENRKKDPAYRIFIRSDIYRILAILYRSGVLLDTETLCSGKDMQKILPVLEDIHRNYAEPLTLEEASARLGFAESYFCRLFRNATGATFTEYVNFVRISKAEKLLARTEMTVLEISQAVGFSSASYFNRIFRKYRSCTPHAYRTLKNVETDTAAGV